MGSLSFFKRPDRYVIVLEDHTMKNLIQNLLLETKNGLRARHTDSFVDNESSFLAE